MMGLNQANSTYFCVWCHVHRDNRQVNVNNIIITGPNINLWLTGFYRHDMTKSTSQLSIRTLDSIRQRARLPRKSPVSKTLGVEAAPILKIPLDHVIIDELHLLLRIVDVLIRWAVSWITLHVVQVLNAVIQRFPTTNSNSLPCINVYVQTREKFSLKIETLLIKLSYNRRDYSIVGYYQRAQMLN